MPILPICRQKLSVCGSFELNSFASFLITDNDQSASSLYRNISARIIISNLEDTVLAIRIDRNNYTINYLTKQLGTHIVAIYNYQQQLPNSPFLFEVTLQSCTGFPGKVPDVSGGCICPSLEAELAGVCVAYITIFPAVIIPIIFCFAVAATAYFLIRKAKEEELWLLKEEHIEWPDPPEMLGSGSDGVVYRAYFRGTPVAIKRYTPKDTQKQIGAKFLASSDLVMMSESRTSRFMDLKSRVSSIGINNDSDIRETIKFLVTVRHPSITPVLGGVFVNGKELCLVLELMELGSLWDCLHNVLFPIEGELVHSFLLSISKGMCFLHAATPPIRHGDLKSGEDESIEIRKFRWTMLCISLTTKPYRSFIHKTLNTFAQDRPALFSYTTSNCMLTQQTSLLTRTVLQKSPTSEKV